MIKKDAPGINTRDVITRGSTHLHRLIVYLSVNKGTTLFVRVRAIRFDRAFSYAPALFANL